MSGALNVPVPSRSPVQDRQAGFGGGLNTVSDPAALTQSQAVLLQNFSLTSFGAARKRCGTRYLHSAALTATPCSGYWWAAKAGTYMGLTDHTVVKQSGFSFVDTSAPFSDPVTELRAFTAATVTTEVLYATDGTTFARYDGTSWTTVVITHVPSYLVVFNQRLWAWDMNTTNSLYYSDLSTATSTIGGDSLGTAASNGGVINVLTFGQSNIIACAVVGSSLMIFQANGISRLTGFGQSDITVDPQPVSTAFTVLPNRNAVCQADSVAYFMSYEGLCVCTEAGVVPVATPTSPDPTGPIALTALTAILTYSPVTREVYCAFPNQGTYIYNTILQAWSGPYTGPFASVSLDMMITVGAGTVNPVLLLSDSLKPGVLEFDPTGTAFSGTFKDYVANNGSGGSNYTGEIICHRMFGGSAYIQGTEATLPVGSNISKSWRNISVLATLVNGMPAPTAQTSVLYGGSQIATFAAPTSQQQTYYMATGGAGPWIDVTIVDTGMVPSQYASVDVEGFTTGRR